MDAATAAPPTKTVPNGYQRTEVGVIPEDWEIFKLNDLTTSIKSGKSNTSSDSGKYPIYGSTGIIGSSDKFDYSGERVLVARVGANAGKVNKVNNGKYGISDNTISIIVSDGYDLNFGYYQLIAKKLNSIVFGSGQPLITGTQLKELDIPLPPTLDEQRAIAGALSEVDALIAALDALIEKKQQVKKGAMQQLLTGNKRLPGFSEDWEEKTLGEIGKFQSGNGFPKEHQGEGNGKYPFFKVSDMNNDGNEVKMKTSNNWISENQRSAISANIMPSGSIVFAKIGAAIFLERKKILVQDSCIDNNMMCFIFDRSYYNHEFIHYLFLSIKLGKLTKTSALPSLSGKDISNLVVRMPELKEQKAIARILSDMDAEIQSLQAKRDKYEKIKQGMMQELLTGKTRLV
jgi:type I restriction enzyme S subunit